jgi:hypothetical protein
VNGGLEVSTKREGLGIPVGGKLCKKTCL